MVDSAAPTGPLTVPKLVKDIDTGSASLSVNGIELTMTVGSMDLNEFFDAQGRPIGDWVEIEVLNRGSELWDRSKFREGAPALSGSTENLSTLMFPAANKDPKAYFVGFSMYEPCPVLVRPPRANSTPKENAMGDSFSGCDFKSEPKGQMTGSSTIVSASIAVPGNMKALKQSLWSIGGKGFNKAFQGVNLVDIKYLAQKSQQALTNGDKTITVQRTTPFQRGSDGNQNILAPAKPVDDRKLRNPSAPKSTLNPLLLDTMPDGKIFIKRGKDVPQGFTYRAPLMANMVYPPELLTILGDFAKNHPQDSMSLKSLLYAAQLWADIMASVGFQQEPLLAEKNPKPKGAQVPECSLEQFLLGFEFWLRFHEEHQLLEFIHPFRFIRALFDSEQQKTDFLPRSHLQATEVIDLLNQATTKWATLGPEIRNTMFPFSMTASNIAWPSGLSIVLEHAEYMMALLNFDNIYSYGWPSLKQRDTKEIKVAMPRIIAETRLGAQGVPIPTQAELQALYQPESSGTKPLFGTMRSFGPIWKPIALPDVEPPKEQPAFTDRVELITSYPFHLFVSETTASLIRQGVMAALENLSQEGRLNLKPDERIEMKANLIPELVNIPKTNFKRICAAPPMTIYPRPEDNSQDAPITVSLAALSTLVSKLDNHTAPLPDAWKDAHNRLRDLGKEGTLPNERTHAHVLRIIKEARAKTNQDKAALVGLSGSLKANPLAILEPAIKQVHVYVCRLIGIPATNKNEWDDLEDQASEVSRDMYALVGLVLRNINRAGKDFAKADGWGMKAHPLLDEILNGLTLKDLETLLEKEEEWLEQTIKDIAAGTHSQSSEPGVTPTA